MRLKWSAKATKCGGKSKLMKTTMTSRIKVSGLIHEFSRKEEFRKLRHKNQKYRHQSQRESSVRRNSIRVVMWCKRARLRKRVMSGKTWMTDTSRDSKWWIRILPSPWIIGDQLWFRSFRHTGRRHLIWSLITTLFWSTTTHHHQKTTSNWWVIARQL